MVLNILQSHKQVAKFLESFAKQWHHDRRHCHPELLWEITCGIWKEDILSTIGGVNPPRGNLNWGSSNKGVSTKGEYGKAICNCKFVTYLISNRAMDIDDDGNELY